jgi:2-deoxy-D-gluconate 3-dehydrogenase
MIDRLIGEVVAEWGKVDILVNNAGICPREEVLDYPVQYWNDTLQTNLIAPWFLAQAAARQMVKQGSGKIINIASLLSHQGGTIVPGYTASKHGILGLTKAMANDLASKGVNVNSITPGYMHTDLTDPLVGNPKFNLEARMPARRWGTAEDLKESWFCWPQSWQLYPWSRHRSGWWLACLVAERRTGVWSFCAASRADPGY